MPEQIPLATYECDGSTKSFAVTFSYLDPAYLVVQTQKRGILNYNSDYTVSGGTVTLGSAPEKLDVLAITRHTPPARPADYEETGEVSGASLNDNFDRITALVEELREVANRCVVHSPTSQESDRDLVEKMAAAAQTALEVLAQGDAYIAESAKNAAEAQDVRNNLHAQNENWRAMLDAKLYVTKFNVYANNQIIQPGQHEVLGTVSEAIPAGMTETFDVAYNRSGTVFTQIDWGDGFVEEFFDVDETKKRIFSHTYLDTGKYTVALYCKEFWRIQHPTSAENLICECFKSDLPVAPHLCNFANFAKGAMRLVTVEIPGNGYIASTKFYNITNLFQNCRNLTSATGFDNRIPQTASCHSVFEGCVNLVTCDFRLPPLVVYANDGANGYRRCFFGCRNLEADIADLIPDGGFGGAAVDVSNAFNGCAKIFGTVPANLLWKDASKTWVPSGCFSGCSDAIRAQVPDPWGGTGGAWHTGFHTPVGAIYAFAGPVAPDPSSGYIPCDGRAVSRTTYRALFEVIGTTYGAGDGGTTFNVPDLRGEFIRGHKDGVTAPVGQKQNDSLPNITGEFLAYSASQGGSGAFRAEERAGTLWVGGDRGTTHTVLDMRRFVFTAAGGNPIFSGSHVVPHNAAVHFIIKW